MKYLVITAGIAIGMLLNSCSSCSSSNSEKGNTQNMKTQKTVQAVSAAQDMSNETLAIKVGGACGMCKSRIEEAANKVNGFSEAKWNEEKQMLSVKKGEAAAETELHKALASVGHDTEKEKASDEVYKSLPGCCKYR